MTESATTNGSIAESDTGKHETTRDEPVRCGVRPIGRKDWESILRDIETPPSSDEEDGLNVQKIKKNAAKISDLLHTVVPGMDPSLSQSVPKGMNDATLFRDEFLDKLEGYTRVVSEENTESTSVAAADEASPSATEKPERGEDTEEGVTV